MANFFQNLILISDKINIFGQQKEMFYGQINF